MSRRNWRSRPVGGLLLLGLLAELAACGITQHVNPNPFISSLSPNSAFAGGAGFTLTVNGGGFFSSSVVRWNGSNRTGDRPESVAVGDFNADGKLDLATANIGSNTVSILLGL